MARNNTTTKGETMPTIRETLSNDKRIKEVWSEADQGDGFWADLAPGYLSAYGTHMLHEMTWSGLRASLAGVEVCDCADCNENQEGVKI